MTRKQQIHQALRLIAPPTQQRAECEQDIKIALSRVEGEVKAARAFQVATSKKALRAISVLVTLSRGIDCLWVLGFILYRRPNPSFNRLSVA